MNRRQYLAAAGIGVSAVGGILGWRWYQSPSLPDGMTVRSWHYEADALAESAASERGPLGPEEQFHTVPGDRDTAEQTLDADVAGAPLTETEFADSSLLVVQTGVVRRNRPPQLCRRRPGATAGRARTRRWRGRTRGPRRRLPRPSRRQRGRPL